MNLSSDRPVTIFRRDYQGRQFYSIGLSKKDRNGTKYYGYMPCQFKKGVSLENKTRVYIQSAFITFYLKDKQTMPYVMITQFETVEETIQNSKSEDPFLQFGDEVDIDNMLD